VTRKIALVIEMLLYSPRFRSNCRHFSRFDFHACRASISKVNRWHTPRSFPSQSSFIRQRPESKIYVCIPPGFIPATFQYSRNIVTPRIVAPLPYFPHARAYMQNHRARTFLMILRDIARLIQWHAKSTAMRNMTFHLFYPLSFLSVIFLWHMCSLYVTLQY